MFTSVLPRVGALRAGIASVRKASFRSSSVYSAFEDLEEGCWLYLTTETVKVHGGARIPAGSLLKVVRREGGRSEGFSTLYLADGRVIPDVPLCGDSSPRNSSPVQNVAQQLKSGLWRYRICFPKGVAVRGRPSLEKPLRTAVLPCDSECLVDLALSTPQTLFLRLRPGLFLETDRRSQTLTEGSHTLTEGWIFTHSAAGTPVCELIEEMEGAQVPDIRSLRTTCDQWKGVY